MTIIVGMAAGLTSVAAVIVGLISFTSAYNDLGRVYGRIAAAALLIVAVGLWLLFAHFLHRADGSDLD